MTPQEKAKELYHEFGDSVERVTEEIVIALYDVGIREPEYWYDVQREISRIQDSEDESNAIMH